MQVSILFFVSTLAPPTEGHYCVAQGKKIKYCGLLRVLISLPSPSILTLKFSQHHRQLGLCQCRYGLKPQAAFQVWCPPAVSTIHSTVNSLHQHDNTKVLRMDVYFDAPSCTKTRAHLELQTNWSNVLLLMIVVQHRRDKIESKWWTEWQMTHDKKKGYSTTFVLY